MGSIGKGHGSRDPCFQEVTHQRMISAPKSKCMASQLLRTLSVGHQISDAHMQKPYPFRLLRSDGLANYTVDLDRI